MKIQQKTLFSLVATEFDCAKVYYVNQCKRWRGNVRKKLYIRYISYPPPPVGGHRGVGAPYHIIPRVGRRRTRSGLPSPALSKNQRTFLYYSPACRLSSAGRRPGTPYTYDRGNRCSYGDPRPGVQSGATAVQRLQL